MCGNFGLLALTQGQQSATPASTFQGRLFQKKPRVNDELDDSLHQTMHAVSRLGGIQLLDTSIHRPATHLFLPSLDILQAQISSTEIRGGQAGGISSMEKYKEKAQVISSRVRAVARKRYPLAVDLAQKYRKLTAKNAKMFISEPLPEAVTYIGHTRFATSSVNTEPELHPHEWTPFHMEDVWSFNTKSCQFEKHKVNVGLHISHNGDFDILSAYGKKVVVNDVGLWLERILHCSNDLKGDSPKVAGCMELFRVQGRWAAAARLAFVRLLNSTTDVTGGEPLSKTAPNTFPKEEHWSKWAQFLESVWVKHMTNVVSSLGFNGYTIDLKAERYFVKALEQELDRDFNFTGSNLGAILDNLSRHGSYHYVHRARMVLEIGHWGSLKVRAFLKHTVRGFLRFDLYTAMTEFLSRAEGSFGLQAHCSLEVGTVVIASKGQPMSLAFDPDLPIVLFGSEAEAVAVPVDESGRWLSERIDLDSNGEIMRIGPGRPLHEGTFSSTSLKATSAAETEVLGLELSSGIDIRCYNLHQSAEISREVLTARSVTILSAPVKYDPKRDLVAADLSVTPAVLAEIDKAWANPLSVEYHAGQSLSETLGDCMRRRLESNLDTVDLIIAGVEASLWVAEQFSSDLKVIFPQLNVVTISANKLLGLGCENSEKVYFPGADEILSRRLDSQTCALLISQSGQTFPSLHATRKLSQLVRNRLWLLTGCFNSKMELAMIESYHKLCIPYGRNRVINNYSGNRPAEPTSVAIVATMHSLTKLMLHFIDVTRDQSPAALLLHSRNSSLNLCSSTSSSSSSNKKIVLALSRGCVEDFKHLVQSSVIPNIAAIVGIAPDGSHLPQDESSIHSTLVKQGRAWGAHISEYWRMLVLVFLYILISVGAGLPIFGLFGDAIAAIILSTRQDLTKGSLSFSPRNYYYHGQNQPIVFTIIGAVLQIADALWFIFLIKVFTWLDRFIHNRPIYARHGKRTIVIVDNPCIHQLVESFVSKLFSQSYSFVSVDVHGASGLDHFVHRFTHRVVRGLLLAVGRPDGRLACLSKSEAGVLLAVKQAVFIRNPEYEGDGSGPDVFTIGHNPFKPNLGVCNAITLPSLTRRKFIDEFIFEKTVSSVNPASSAAPSVDALYHEVSCRFESKKEYNEESSDDDKFQQRLPLGSHLIRRPQHIDDCYVAIFDDHPVKLDESYNDPAVRCAFGSQVEASSLGSQSYAKLTQYLYESRIASLERYVSFCVVFHAMAKHCCAPWFKVPWDIARSQSNLRVATTASPISAHSETGGEHESSIHKNKFVLKFCSRINPPCVISRF